MPASDAEEAKAARKAAKKAEEKAERKAIAKAERKALKKAANNDTKPPAATEPPAKTSHGTPASYESFSDTPFAPAVRNALCSALVPRSRRGPR